MRSISSTRRLGLVALLAGATAAVFVALAYAAPNQPSAALVAPVNTSPPTISDTTPESGQELTANPGTWTGDAPIVFTYEWLRCNPAGTNCVEIPTATLVEVHGAGRGRRQHAARPRDRDERQRLELRAVRRHVAGGAGTAGAGPGLDHPGHGSHAARAARGGSGPVQPQSHHAFDHVDPGAR